MMETEFAPGNLPSELPALNLHATLTHTHTHTHTELEKMPTNYVLG